MISDDGNAERGAREPSNDVLDLRVVIEEGNEYAKTDQAREFQRSDNPRAAIAVFSDLGFHVDGQYLRIAHLACAEGHALYCVRPALQRLTPAGNTRHKYQELDPAIIWTP